MRGILRSHWAEVVPCGPAALLALHARYNRPVEVVVIVADSRFRVAAVLTFVNGTEIPPMLIRDLLYLHLFSFRPADQPSPFLIIFE
jgi:endonuclease YncB( thermonuclease family)